MKIGAKVVSHGRYVTFQLADVAVPTNLFREILHLIDYTPQRAIATAQVCAFYPQETSRDAPAGVATSRRQVHGKNGVRNAARLRAARRNAAASRPLRVAGLPPAA